MNHNYINTNNNIRSQTQNRNEVIDIAKGVGIVFVVLGHLPTPISGYLYLFHMAFFFLISGWCFSEKNAQTPLMFIKKRFIRLLMPVILFQIVAELLLVIDYDYWNYSIEHYHLMGTLWFLKDLFKASLFTIVCVFLFSRFDFFKYWCVPIFAILGAFVCSYVEIKHLYEPLYISFFYTLGFVIKKYAPYIVNPLHMTRRNISLYMGGVVFLLLVKSLLPPTIGDCNHNSFIQYGLTSIIGSYLVFQFCYVVKTMKFLCRIIKILGENTMPIVLYQWIVFWIIDLLQSNERIKFYDDSIIVLTKLIAGLFVPLMLQNIVESIKLKRYSKI